MSRTGPTSPDEDDEDDAPRRLAKPAGLFSRGLSQIRKWLGWKEPKKRLIKRKKRRRGSDAVPEVSDSVLVEAEQEMNAAKSEAVGEDKGKNGRDREPGEDLSDPDAPVDPVRYSAAVKIQAMIRRFLARFARHRQWKIAVKSAEYFALSVQEAKQLKAAGSRQRRIMQELFIKTYVFDVLSTAKLFLIQSAVIVQIQALYRGFRIRKLYNFRCLLRKPKPPPTRITTEMARRVWARAEFGPKGGWPGMRTSVLEYDMFEHAHRPPSGRDYGVKTFKVLASARNKREEQVLLADKAAWVGLPVHLEPQELFARRKKEKNPSIMLLHGTTPYLEHRTVELKPPPKLQGVALLRALGWSEDMIDRQAPVVPPVQRTGYQMINPLDTHKMAHSVDSMSLPNALHKRIRNKPPAKGSPMDYVEPPTLGGLQQSAVETIIAPNNIVPGANASRTRSVWTSQNINENSVILPDVLPGEDRGVGGGVGGGGSSVLNGGSGSSTVAASMSATFLSEPEGKYQITKLITPLRGPLKPIPSSHRAALAQHSLLPAQVNRAYRRVQTNGFEDERWKNSAWGALKLKAAELAAAEHSNASLLAEGGDDEATIGSLDSGGSLSIHPSRSSTLKGLKNLKDDPWSRQLFRPKIQVPCRIAAFPVKPKKHFKVRYSWIPQSLLQEAANKVYKDGRDVSERTYTKPSPYPPAPAQGSFLTAPPDSPFNNLDLNSQPSFVTHWTSLESSTVGETTNSNGTDAGREKILGSEVNWDDKGKKKSGKHSKNGVVDHPYAFL